MAVFNGRAKPPKANAPRALTSAATPVRLRNRSELETLRNRNALSHAWQMEAWRVYNAIGEVSYAFNLVASALSQVRIHPAVIVNPDEPPTEVTDAAKLDLPDGGEVGAKGGIDPRLAAKAREYIGNLNKGVGMASLLRSYALNKQVAGECYLCLIKDRWSVKSTFEIIVDPSGRMRHQPSQSTLGGAPEDLPPKSSVYRMWTQHPMYSSDPDCSVRAVLFLCEQLILLNRMTNNTIRSRMNAGILKVAASIVAASRTPGTEGNVDDNGVEELSPFEVDLHAVTTQPVQDDQAGAAVIPMVAIVPDELVGPGIEWMSLARDVDEHMIAYAETVLVRILQGLAIPKDLITGFSAVRYSNAQQVSEDVYKQSVEPLALAFVDDITDVYLRPLLRADAKIEGWDLDEVERVVAWFDASAVTARPDRGADADAGWDRGALSDDAWRAAHSFSAEDAPSEDEKLQRALLQKEQMPPNLVDWLARELLPQYFKGAPPLVTKTQAGMSESDAATTPLGKAHQPGASNPTANPAGSGDQDVPPGGTLPPRTP